MLKINEHSYQNLLETMDRMRTTAYAGLQENRVDALLEIISEVSILHQQLQEGIYLIPEEEKAHEIEAQI